MLQFRRHAITFTALLGLSLALPGCTTTGSNSPAEVEASAPALANPQPAAASLQPGLSALYVFGEFEDVREMPNPAEAKRKGTRGPAVTKLDASDGKGKIFDSTQQRLYGIQFDGYVNLAQPGTYRFAATSNDGVRARIGGVTVAHDPNTHPERTTPPVALNITEPGWYPIRIQYFQKQGGATLQFWWQPPGASAMAIIPASVIANNPAE